MLWVVVMILNSMRIVLGVLFVSLYWFRVIVGFRELSGIIEIVKFLKRSQSIIRLVWLKKLKIGVFLVKEYLLKILLQSLKCLKSSQTNIVTGANASNYTHH